MIIARLLILALFGFAIWFFYHIDTDKYRGRF